MGNRNGDCGWDSWRPAQGRGKVRRRVRGHFTFTDIGFKYLWSRQVENVGQPLKKLFWITNTDLRNHQGRAVAVAQW